MILSISDISGRCKRMAKTGFVYLVVSLFCALFGAVYESFSHEVYSYYMLYAFVIPLAGGALPFFSLAFSGWPVPGRICRKLYHSGIATLTVGSIMQGVLEIYGTTNRLVLTYWLTGAFLSGLGLILYVGKGIKKS